jgi:L-threonylcarbamoyladenylate synthase
LHTEVLASDQESSVDRALDLLRRDQVVALPTETVYGLAGSALKTDAVANIFSVKERPSFDPLIVHLPNMSWLDRVAEIPGENRVLIGKLLQDLWPGPLTILLPRRDIVPDLVTAGLPRVALRMSAHPLFSRIITAFDAPLAAPSANRFGRISPTTAQHVLEELNGRIPLIIDAGRTQHGLESTIIAVKEGRIGILRKGPITAEKLSEYAEVDDYTGNRTISAPGQLASHYAPRTRLRILSDQSEFSPRPYQRVGLLAWQKADFDAHFAAIRVLSPAGDLKEAAANLFLFLRELDNSDLDLIVAEEVPKEGLGAAIMDRLVRAATR